MSLHDLGIFYLDLGRYEKAIQYQTEAMAIFENFVGKEHLGYVRSLSYLALIYHSMGLNGKAAPLYIEANRLQINNLLKSVRFLSEKELSKYVLTFNDDLNKYFSFAQSVPGSDNGIAARSYDNALFHKGFLLSAVTERNNLCATDSVAASLANLQKLYLNRLERAYAKPVAERDSADVAAWEEKVNQLEKELAQRVVGFGDASRQVGWQEVQAKLRPNEAAIEFVHYQFWRNQQKTDSIQYTAILLRPGNTAPTFIPLFEEKQLDELLPGTVKRRVDYVEHLYALAGREAMINKKQQRTIYDLVWRPIVPHLSGVKKVYFSPSGLLHRVNLSAIPVSEDTVLADLCQLVQLGSTRQLVAPGTTTDFPTRDAVLFGGIIYDADSTTVNDSDTIRSSTIFRGELDFSMTDTSLRGGSWKYLKATQKEAADIGDLMRANGFAPAIRSGHAATEDFFKSIGQGTPSPRILHLATHGFFFPDPASTNVDRRSLEGEPVFKISDHPMIRSGLILANANYAWKGGHVPEGKDDGILTAYEISQMNLSGTELVVLSACETGLGQIRGNEGVYGLQRAFKIAGAKYLLMSLWQVPDKHTQELMTIFYQKWLGEKQDIRAAFRGAQMEMRAKYKSPFYWAGFVLVE
ncbi:MAG TPA: CHAT domain-containing protein, partial [Saprospiraceae bacterium]|nr:CHAT domain-containing protein [Saprospiraceae bacterium]